MDEDRFPAPEPWGGLEPPHRRPPTAVGVMTPPPPPRPGASHHAPNLRRRLALGFVGVTTVAAGIGVAALAAGPLGFGVGAAVALLGSPLLHAAVRTGRRDTPVVPFATRRARRRAA